MLAAPGALRVSEWGEQDREDTFCEPATLWDMWERCYHSRGDMEKKGED